MNGLALISALLLTQPAPVETNVLSDEQIVSVEAVTSSIQETEGLDFADDSTSETIIFSSGSATYTYFGSEVSSTGTDYLYNYSLEAGYCTFFYLYISYLVSEADSSSAYSLRFDIPGDYEEDGRSYRIVDYVSSTYLYSVESYNGYLTVEYTSVTGFTLCNGYISFVIFSQGNVPAMETLYSSQLSYRTVYEDLSYGSDANEVMDLYVPNGMGSLPVIITIHGGYWSEMPVGFDPSYQEYYDRTYYDYLEDPSSPYFNGILSKEGYVHANIDYRLNGANSSVSLSMMLNDITTAIFTVSQVCGNRVDLSRICLWGYSAGGHLAMMYSLNPPVGNNGISYAPKMMISEAGPFHLTTSDSSPGNFDVQGVYQNLCGLNDTPSTDNLDQISPCFNSNRQRQPSFTIANYFTNDLVVPSDDLITEMFTAEYDGSHFHNASSSYVFESGENYPVDVGLRYYYVHQQYRKKSLNYLNEYLLYLDNHL